MTLALLSALIYGGVLAYAVVHATAAAIGTGALGGLGALVLVVALARANAELVSVPPVFLGVAYTIALVVAGGSVDGAAPLVAAGLLLCAELAAWSIDERLRIPAEPAVVRARAVALSGLAFGSLAVAALIVALVGTSAGGGLAWTVLGAASAVAVVGLAVGLARRA